jgi:uncharacterized protein with NRDE domain
VCTVSAARTPDGDALRIVINRDERRSRMSARPPELFECGGVTAAWPVDQHAGGTWAAITASGLAFALLNVSSTPASTDDRLVTRGAIIPALAEAVDIDDAVQRFGSGPAHWSCRPFKLVIASLERLVVLTPQGISDIELPAVLATSGLGDAVVEAPRRQLFEELLRTSASAWQAQDRLHQHAWPDRRHLSVLMSRVDACTVSRTEILIARDSSTLRYAAIHDGWPAGIAVPPVTISRRRVAVAA